ncbi:MAG TPA: NAD/NADP octopine/nopaline dehydrogenase family protein [Stellaceae bacterium]|nr:NAD/NADP octopine/nopaline dehydrogenase family protein [Stellaceae bacterium]
MRVAILGAGAGGAAAVAQMLLAGHDASLWNRSAETLEPFLAIGGVEYEGVLGSGTAKPKTISADIGQATAGAEAILVCLPTFSHGLVARLLAELNLGDHIPVILNPGHTGGALEFEHAYRAVRPNVPPIAEFSTLTYIARKLTPERVTVTGAAKRVRAAALPGAEAALDAARRLFACVSPVRDVLNSGLSNVNMVLHPPGAVLGAAWVEARGGDFTFYVDGMTPGVARVMKALDEERRAVALAFGHDLPPLVAEMQAIGTVEASVTDVHDLVGAIAGGVANRRIKAPNSLSHRYYLEDFGHGLLPFLAFARIANVAVPIAESLLRLASVLTDKNFNESGRTAERMGIAGLNAAQLIQKVRGRGRV